MQDPQVKAKRIQSLALSFFLGASAGNWCPTHLPTIENPYLEITYLHPDGTPGIDSRGKPKGRPFKLLNASARPHKKIRMTKYFAKCHADLLTQTIKLYDLKPDITPEELVQAYKYCITKAESLIHFRLATSEVVKRHTEADENKKLRKLLNVTAKTVLGDNYSTTVEKSGGGLIVKLYRRDEKTMASGEKILEDKIMAMTPTVVPPTSEVEKVVINEMLKHIITNRSDIVKIVV